MQAHADATRVYSKRFDTVLAYIDTNLEGDLSVDALSHIANFSKFHFHRQFAAYVGIPVARYVQLMRLRRAARRLASRESCSVLDAALDADFDSPEAFSRVFKRAFGTAPSLFRQRPNWQIWSATFVVPYLSRKLAMQVRIVDFSERLTNRSRRMTTAFANSSFRAADVRWSGMRDRPTTLARRSIRSIATGFLQAEKNCGTSHWFSII